MTFSQARHPTKTREINGTETPHTESRFFEHKWVRCATRRARGPAKGTACAVLGRRRRQNRWLRGERSGPFEKGGADGPFGIGDVVAPLPVSHLGQRAGDHIRTGAHAEALVDDPPVDP